MKSTATLIAAANPADPTSDAAERLRDLGVSLPPPPPPPGTPPAPGLLRTLWARMLELYGHRWKVHFGDSADSGAGETWSKALFGLTAADLARGLESCLLVDDNWPPSAPRFRALCLGIPSIDEVKSDLLAPHSQRQGFTRLVWKFLDGYAWRRADAREGARMLQAAYDRAKHQRMQGFPLPPAPVEISAPTAKPPVPADPEAAQAAIDEARRLLGSGTPEQDEGEGELSDGDDGGPIDD